MLFGLLCTTYYNMWQYWPGFQIRFALLVISSIQHFLKKRWMNNVPLCVFNISCNDRNKQLFTMQALAKFGIWMTLIVYTMYYTYSTRNYCQYAVSSFRWSISWWWNCLCPYKKWQKYRQWVVWYTLNFSYIDIVL